MTAATAAAITTGEAPPIEAGSLPQAWTAAAVKEDAAAPDGVKDAITAQSSTVGDAIETLDGIAIQIGSYNISVWDVLVVILVILGLYAIAHFATRLAHKALKSAKKLDDGQRLLAEKLVSLAIWTVAFLIAIDLLGIDLTVLAVFSGAFGLAIGFGLQKTFGNLIAGIILLMDKSIKPGDVIAIADQSGKTTFGEINKIGIRAVSVTTRDQREYLIPNENLMINQVENWSYSSKNVRIQVHAGVSYNCDIKLAEKLMLQAAGDCDRILKSPPPTAWLDGYGDSSVNFIIHCWIRDPENGTGNIRSMVLKRLWDLLQENDIEIPFPQRDLNLRGNDQFEQLVAAISQRVEDKS